ncbi:MAG: serine hydrolase [Rhizobacter sp.]|nr:serine hydrolase [Ferruginibacter sp.]
MTINHFTVLPAIYILFIFLSCSPAKKIVLAAPVPAGDSLPLSPAPAVEKKEDEFMLQLFKTQPLLFDNILSNRSDLNVQVIYTQIDRQASGPARFTHHTFNKNRDSYFYPASTVKFPVVLLALQKLNELKIAGLDKNSTMITDAGFSGQQATFNDPNTSDGRPTIAQYIKQVLLVSDNDAFNRLYEFLGQEYINRELHKKGYGDIQVLHRLNIFLTETENRTTNPVRFFDSNNKLLHEVPLQVNRQQYAKRNDLLGAGYYSGGKLINQPMDFSKKNRMNLQDFHDILLSIIFPDKVEASQRFNITEEDRRFVLQYMSEYPGESTYPFYDKNEYHDAYVKMILFGNEKGTPPPAIRIFNKTGTAYGQLTETAYIIDFDKNIEFIVAATIDCNTDKIYNDDQYAYESIGYPFLKNLGRLLYQYELNRPGKIKPDLSGMKFTYD